MAKRTTCSGCEKRNSCTELCSDILEITGTGNTFIQKPLNRRTGKRQKIMQMETLLGEEKELDPKRVERIW